MKMMAAKVSGLISTVFTLENVSIGFDTEWVSPANAAEAIAKTNPNRGDE